MLCIHQSDFVSILCLNRDGIGKRNNTSESITLSLNAMCCFKKSSLNSIFLCEANKANIQDEGEQIMKKWEEPRKPEIKTKCFRIRERDIYIEKSKRQWIELQTRLIWTNKETLIQKEQDSRCPLLTEESGWGMNGAKERLKMMMQGKRDWGLRSNFGCERGWREGESDSLKERKNTSWDRKSTKREREREKKYSFFTMRSSIIASLFSPLQLIFFSSTTN